MTHQLSPSPHTPSGGSPSPGTPSPSPLSRPSAISTRPQLSNQGRLRSRSINNSAQPQATTGADAGGKQGEQAFLAPTLVGSPELGPGEHFGEGHAEAGSAHPAGPNGSSKGWKPPAITLTSSDGNFYHNGGPSSSSSSSSGAQSASSGQGPYANGGLPAQVRRGRSFTSLLVQPTIPSGGVTPFANVEEEVDGYFEKDYARRSSSPEDVEAGFAPPHPSNPSDPLLATDHNSTLSADPARRRNITEFLPHIAILGFLFLASFLIILALVATLSALFIPHSFSQLPALVSALVEYRSSSWLAEVHLFAVLSCLFVWKQAFSIPGSILTNAIFGALYGTGIGTAWACLWTAVGSTGAYGIARVIAPLVEYYFATPLAMTRRTLKLQAPVEAGPRPGAVDEPVHALSSGDLFSYLLLARFFPLLPYSVMNVIAGVLRLPLPTFFVTLVLGSFPFNFVTVSVGAVVAVAAADPDTPLGDKIWTSAMLAKLVGVTVVSVAPMLFKKQLQRTLGNPRLAAIVVSLPHRVVWALSRAGERVVRLFGALLGTATPETQAAPVGAYQSLASHLASSPASPVDSAGATAGRASHETTDSEGGRAWRHKWNPSWGGDGFRLIESLTGGGREAGGELLGRWEEEEASRRTAPARGETM